MSGIAVLVGVVIVVEIEAAIVRLLGPRVVFIFVAVGLVVVGEDEAARSRLCESRGEVRLSGQDQQCGGKSEKRHDDLLNVSRARRMACDWGHRKVQKLKR